MNVYMNREIIKVINNAGETYYISKDKIAQIKTYETATDGYTHKKTYHIEYYTTSYSCSYIHWKTYDYAEYQEKLNEVIS